MTTPTGNLTRLLLERLWVNAPNVSSLVSILGVIVSLNVFSSVESHLIFMIKHTP